MPSSLPRALLRELLPPIAHRALGALRARLAGTTDVGREQPAAFYDQTFDAHDHWRKHYTQSHYYPVWAVLGDRVARAHPRSVLDIGCGPGQVAAMLRDKGVPRYLGVDFSGARIAQARIACPEFEFVEADVFDCDALRTRDYDTLVCTEFLEHVERDLDVLRAVRPGTRCFCTVPSFPAAQHVRHFGSVAEVRERYAPLFSSFDVTEQLAAPNGRRFFIFEGVRASA